MRTSLPVLAFALVLPLAACGAKVTVDGSSTSTGSGGAGAGAGGGASMPRLGHFQPDCAPNDGPATWFILDGATTCQGPATGGQPPFIDVTIFGPMLANLHSGGTVTVSMDINGGAQGSSVTADGTVIDATGGTFFFSSFVDGVSAAGSFDLTLVDGSHAQGAFSVSGCMIGVTCG